MNVHPSTLFGLVSTFLVSFLFLEAYLQGKIQQESQESTDWKTQQTRFFSKSPLVRSGDRGSKLISRHDSLRTSQGEASIDLEAIISSHVVFVDPSTNVISLNCNNDFIEAELVDEPSLTWMTNGTILSLNQHWGCDNKTLDSRALRRVLNASWNSGSKFYEARTEKAAFNECFERLTLSMNSITYDSTNTSTVVKDNQPVLVAEQHGTQIYTLSQVPPQVHEKSPKYNPDKKKLGDRIELFYSLDGVAFGSIVTAKVLMDGWTYNPVLHSENIQYTGYYSWIIDGRAQDSEIFIEIHYNCGWILCSLIQSAENDVVAQANVMFLQPDGSQVIPAEKSINLIWQTSGINNNYPLIFYIYMENSPGFYYNLKNDRAYQLKFTNVRSDMRVSFKVDFGYDITKNSKECTVSPIYFESPLVDQYLEVGKSVLVKWASSSYISPFTVLRFFFSESEAGYGWEMGSFSNSQKEFSFNIPLSAPAGSYNIQIIRASDGALLHKSANLYIPDKSVIFTKPEKEGSFNVGDTIEIRWNSVSMSHADRVVLYVYSDIPFFFDDQKEIATIQNTGYYYWTVPQEYKDYRCYFSIKVGGMEFFGEAFLISDFKLITPRPGEVLRPYGTMQISWSYRASDNPDVYIYLVKDIPLWLDEEIYLGTTKARNLGLNVGIKPEWDAFFNYYLILKFNWDEIHTHRFSIAYLYQVTGDFSIESQKLEASFCSQSCQSATCDVCSTNLVSYLDLDINTECRGCKIQADATIFNLDLDVYIFQVKRLTSNMKGSISAVLDLNANINMEMSYEKDQHLLALKIYTYPINLITTSYNCDISMDFHENRNIQVTAVAKTHVDIDFQANYHVTLKYPPINPNSKSITFDIDVINNKEPTVSLDAQATGSIYYGLQPSIIMEIIDIFQAKASFWLYVVTEVWFRYPPFPPSSFIEPPIFPIGDCSVSHFLGFNIITGSLKPILYFEVLSTAVAEYELDYEHHFNLAGGCLLNQIDQHHKTSIKFDFVPIGYEQLSQSSISSVIQKDLSIAIGIPTTYIVVSINNLQRSTSMVKTAEVEILPFAQKSPSQIESEYRQAVLDPKSVLYDGPISKNTLVGSVLVNNIPLTQAESSSNSPSVSKKPPTKSRKTSLSQKRSRSNSPRSMSLSFSMTKSNTIKPPTLHRPQTNSIALTSKHSENQTLVKRTPTRTRQEHTISRYPRSLSLSHVLPSEDISQSALAVENTNVDVQHEKDGDNATFPMHVVIGAGGGFALLSTATYFARKKYLKIQRKHVMLKEYSASEMTDLESN